VGGKGGGEMEAMTGGWGSIEDKEERDEQRWTLSWSREVFRGKVEDLDLASRANEQGPRGRVNGAKTIQKMNIFRDIN